MDDGVYFINYNENLVIPQKRKFITYLIFLDFRFSFT